MEWNDDFVEANEEDEFEMHNEEPDDYDYEEDVLDRPNDNSLSAQDGTNNSEVSPQNQEAPFLLNHPPNATDTTTYNHIYGSEAAMSDSDEDEASSSLNMLGREVKSSENWRLKKQDSAFDLDWRNQVSSDNVLNTSKKNKGLCQRQFMFATRSRKAHVDPLKFGAFDRVPEMASQQCTLPDGRRIFFPLVPKTDAAVEEPQIQLLNTPIARLVEQVDAERLKIINPSVRRQDSSSTSFTTHATLGSMSDGEGDEAQKQDVSEVEREKSHEDKLSKQVKAAAKRGQPPPNSCQEKQLWVDKYAPDRFSDLLSAENINRGVLNAIKSWDAFVFGSSVEASRACEAKATSQFNFKKQEKLVVEDDKDKRPRVKVVLLCGPPGLGKTTLAHVVAKHAGYNPMEVNASDDRSAAALKEKLVRALESKSVFGDKKPNLVILDEIDGADAKGSINALIEIIKAPLRKHSGKGKQPLTRPLICICNDIYAAHLRPLREVSMVYNFKNPSEARLLTRLKTICRLEAASGGGLGDMSASALQSLCHATNNDTRSAINTLQFVAMRYSKSLKNHASSSAMLLRTLDSGLKDERKDVFEVFSSIFWRKYSTQKQSAALHRKQSNSQYSSSPRGGMSSAGGVGGQKGVSFSSSFASSPSADSSAPMSGCLYAMNSASTHGEYDMIANGIHENFIKIPFIDPSFTKTCEMTEWLCWQSQLQRKINDEQLWFLLAYIPAVAAATYSLAAVDFKPQFTLPKQDQLVRQATIQRNEIVTSFQNGIEVKQCSGSRNTVVLDLIPQLLTILSPKLRPVSSDVYSKEEKETMANMVETLEAFGLSYTQAFGDRIEQGAGYQLTPELDLLVQYEKHKEDENKQKNKYSNQAQDVGKKPAKPSHWSTVTAGSKGLSGGRTPGTAPLIPNFLRMMVARDVELAKFRRKATAAALAAGQDMTSPSKQTFKSPNKNKKSPVNHQSSSKNKKQKSPMKEAAAKQATPNTTGLKTTAPAATAAAAAASLSVKRDFFGRVIEDKQMIAKEEAANQRAAKLAKTSLIGQDIHHEGGEVIDESNEEDDEEAVRVKYAFQKGFTNAIKRPVYMADLL